MGLAEQLVADMKHAMKNGEKQRLNTIRQLRSQIKNAQIDSGEELDEAGIIKVLHSAAKKRKDAMEMYKKGGRDDLFAIEEAELAVIQAYLPKQLDAAEISAIIAEVITETGSAGAGDFGKVMIEVMELMNGIAGGKTVQPFVRGKLA